MLALCDLQYFLGERFACGRLLPETRIAGSQILVFVLHNFDWTRMGQATCRGLNVLVKLLLHLFSHCHFVRVLSHFLALIASL